MAGNFLWSESRLRVQAQPSASPPNILVSERRVFTLGLGACLFQAGAVWSAVGSSQHVARRGLGASAVTGWVRGLVASAAAPSECSGDREGDDETGSPPADFSVGGPARSKCSDRGGGAHEDVPSDEAAALRLVVSEERFGVQ